MNRIPNYSCSRLTLKIDEPGSGFNDRHDSALVFKIALTVNNDYFGETNQVQSRRRLALMLIMT